MYIIFEGIDTCGKSTQIERLCKKNSSFLQTYEPGNSDLGKDLRELILHKGNISKEAEFFLFLADRAEHYDKFIKPNLDKTILSDRGFISGMAYALANDDKLDMEFLFKTNRYALNNFLPQKIVFFEIDEESLKKRFTAKKNDVIEKRGLEYLLHVQKCMKKIIKYIKIETLFINASDDIDKITKQIEGFLK